MIGLILTAITAYSLLMRSKLPALPQVSEQFDPDLAAVSSVDEFMLVLESSAPVNATAVEKLDLADALLRRRFVHSYSYFRFDQDWVAASLRPLWDDLASPVRPDDVLKFRRAACSQQAMVFQEVARRLGFDFGTVGVEDPGHFLAAVKIDGRWWVYDANKEMAVRRYPLDDLLAGSDRMLSIYEAPFSRQLIEAANAKRVALRDVNSSAAPQAALLHTLTSAVSSYGWLVMLALWALLRFAVPVRAGDNRRRLSTQPA